jgi:O-antigen ligase
MTKITSAALFFLAAGIFTSVTILSAYQILFAIPLAYYIYLAFKNKDFELPKSAWFLLAFTAVALLSLIINYDLIPKPSKNFGRLKYFLFGVGGIFVLKSWLKEATDQTKKILVNTFLISIIFAGTYVIYSYIRNVLILEIDGRGRPLTETMRYGYGSGMILLSLFSLILHREKVSKWFDFRIGLIALIVGFTGMYLTYTRGALLGFISGLPLVLYFYRPKIGYSLGLISLLGIGLLGSIYLFGSGSYKSRYLMSKNNESDTIRRSQWTAALIAIKERPILGWGLSNFHSQLKRIKNYYNLPAQHYNDAHAHNIYLEIGAGTGIIGLFLFLAFLSSWAFECSKNSNILLRSLIIPYGASFVISSFFEVTFDANNASTFFFLYAFSSTKNILDS